MSNNPSHQPHSRTVLPPIGNLIDAADRGMYQKYNERQRYPPTSEAAAHGNYPSMHGQGVHLPANMAHHGAQARGRGDPHYPTPPNSTRPEVTTYPTQAASTSGGGASSRRHVCTECGQAFDRPSSLQTHMHTHTGEQPFECPYPGCGRRFSVKSNMRRHISVHEQPRMTDADTEEFHDSRHSGNGEYGVFSVARR